MIFTDLSHADGIPAARLADLHRIYKLLVLHDHIVDLEACLLIWHAWSEINESEWRQLPAEDSLLLQILTTQAQLLALDTEGIDAEYQSEQSTK